MLLVLHLLSCFLPVIGVSINMKVLLDPKDQWALGPPQTNLEVLLRQVIASKWTRTTVLHTAIVTLESISLIIISPNFYSHSKSLFKLLLLTVAVALNIKINYIHILVALTLFKHFYTFYFCVNKNVRQDNRTMKLQDPSLLYYLFRHKSWLQFCPIISF